MGPKSIPKIACQSTRIDRTNFQKSILMNVNFLVSLDPFIFALKSVLRNRDQQ